MCRVAGIISGSFEKQTVIRKVKLMCAELAHGGPDDEGLFFDEVTGVAFGHRRLAIIDISANGHQPMADAGKKAWITFNGEIYNYRELKRELLAAGALFCTDSDTEVIINAYLHWGTASFAKLRGIFAFALYDVDKKITLLVRDTTGIKPLYYHLAKGCLSFASEIKAFRAAGIARETDETWRIKFLAFGHIPEPFTTLKDVFSLPKGHFLVWNHRSLSFEIRDYQKSDTRAPIKDGTATLLEIQNELAAAVERQLIADAPIGVFLSGGIDSSILSLLANETKKDQLKTISIYFNERSYDERQFQNLVLQKLSGEKYCHLVTPNDFEQFFPRIMADMDMPTTDGINTWFISKYARESGLKAVLSGLGADELFGGYPSFNRIKYLRQLHKLPRFLTAAAGYFGADRYRKLSFLAHKNPIADYLLLRGLFVPGDIARALNTDEKQVCSVLFNACDVPPLATYDEEHAAWFETNLYMQNQLLRDTDVMSMSHGLEVRVPFLDEEFQELTRSIPPRLRFDSEQPKKILIESFYDILPPETWKRPKMGFTFPLQEWMRTHEEISNEKLYDGKFAQEAILRFKNGKMHWSKAFALYQIQLHA